MKNVGIIICLITAFFTACAHTHPRTGATAKEKNPYYSLIRSHLKAFEGDPDASLKDLLKAMEAFPEEATLKAAAAERYSQLQNWEKALPLVDEALRIKPEWVEAKLLKGRILEAMGDFEKAGLLFQELIQDKPDQEAGYVPLAENLIHREKYREAVAVLQQWLAKNPESAAFLYYIATIQNVYLKEETQALETYQRLLKLDPDDIRVRSQMAQIYFKREDRKNALEQYQFIERQYPKDISIKLQIAAIYQDLGELDKAIAMLQAILEINPMADRIHYFLGLLYVKSEQGEKAVAHFQKVPPSSNLYKDAILQEASVYHDQKENKKGLDLLKKAIRLKPKNPPFFQFLSLIWEEEGKMNLAVESLKEGLKKNPEEEELLFSLGVLYDKLKQRRESIATMERVLKRNPKNAQALNYIGYTYAEMGENLEEAEKMILQALELKPGDAYITDSLGWVYYQKGDLKKALHTIEKAWRTMPAEPVIAEHLGDVFLKLGEKGKARSFFKKAVEFGKKKEKPNGEEIQRVEEKLKNLEN